MKRKYFVKVALFCLLTLDWILPALAIPGYITISGRLLDASNNPVHYYEMRGGAGGLVKTEIKVNLNARLDFFDSETTPTFFAMMYTTATVYNGYFSIKVVPPDPVLAKDSVWYDLSIDADRNGLTGGDQFEGRFELGAVPFALQGAPRTFFTTFERMNNGYSAIKNNRLMVCPFLSPQEGVEFNQMNIIADGSVGNTFSFGIYDEQGKRVAYSGRITFPSNIYDKLLEVKQAKTRLQPSKIYYVGLTCNSATMDFPQGFTPLALASGVVGSTSTNGDSPAQFSPAAIDSSVNINILPVHLLLVDDSIASQYHWNVNKPDQPAYRWSQTNSSSQEKLNPGKH